MTKAHKERITIAIDKELLEWIDAEIEQRHFANRSHAIQSCLFESRKAGRKEP